MKTFLRTVPIRIWLSVYSVAPALTLAASPIGEGEGYATIRHQLAAQWNESADSHDEFVAPLQLERRALRLQSLVERKIIQTHGLIPMFVHANDYLLPNEIDYRGAYRHRHLLGKTEKELGLPPMYVWRAWENTASDTAFYLGAMSYRYRCLADPESLAICRRTWQAMRYIYLLGVAKGERGNICKPYGGVYSTQTSGDQVQCALWGISAYRDIASPEDRSEIDAVVNDMAKYQIKTAYVSPHGYFGWSPQAIVDVAPGHQLYNLGWSDGIIYTALLYKAWEYGGDRRTLSEIDHWYAGCGTAIPNNFKEAENLKGPEGPREFYLPALLSELDPGHYELWRAMMLHAFRSGRTGLFPDGTCATKWVFDGKSGRSSVFPGVWAGGGAMRTGRQSAQFAMGCVTAQRWCGEEKMVVTAKYILDRLDEDKFRFVMPYPKGGSLPAATIVEGKLLDLDALTAWLWAYWEGRWRGYW